MSQRNSDSLKLEGFLKHKSSKAGMLISLILFAALFSVHFALAFIQGSVVPITTVILAGQFALILYQGLCRRVLEPLARQNAALVAGIDRLERTVRTVVVKAKEKPSEEGT